MGIELGHDASITAETIAALRAEMEADRTRRTMMNAVRRNGLPAVALNHDALVAMQYTFSHEIPTGPATSQEKSGRCWMFAGLNTLRVAVMRRLNLSEFELSQSYLMFWDKFEKANYFLENILETLDEPRDGRLVAWLLATPTQDGGQWDMFVNLVEKYGVVPKWIMPETFHSSNSAGMNRILDAKLREDARTLREAYARGAGWDELSALKADMLRDIYRMLTIFLGDPPERFDFVYRDKDQQYGSAEGLTPKMFYDRYVERDLADYVSVINAPTADKPFGRTFTVQYLGNVKGGREVRYLNVDVETMRGVALRQLLDGEPVWFGCDVGKMMDREKGVLDTALYDYEGVLGVPLRLTKAERLDYGESLMTHAMVFTGVHLVDGRPLRWKVENSWGSEPGNKGFFVMSDDWFGEFTYQVVVHRRYLPPELQAALAEPPIVLPPWDPMGSLACRP
jgi:bleomycin hydrolase